MNVDVDRLYEQLPHADAMRLIDEVVSWGPDAVVCRVRNHRDPAHPLRTDNGLRAICIIEYAAQAAALHALLLAGDGGPGSMESRALLALVNGLELETAYLHDGDSDLVVEGSFDFRSGGAVMYRFEARDGTRTIARGRLGLTS